MSYSYLNPSNLSTVYEDSKQYTKLLTEPFAEFQRIARNRPHKGIDPAYPKTTDGTSASIVQKTPKRVVQQLPTGKVTGDGGHEWLYLVAGYIYQHKIIPYANEDYGLFEKSQLIIENGLTFGFGASYTPFLNHDGYFCPDLTLPYWGDIFLQRGKRSGYSCSYIFYRVWWQKADIKALIDSETKLAAKAKKRGDKYQATWDIQALNQVYDKLTSKDEQARTPVDKERNTNPEGVELITAFQKGVGAKFYTFCPSISDTGDNDVTIVRTKTNKDPRGKMPIDWFYGDIDGDNPLGRGIIELIGGLQNLIDSDMQMYQYNRALMLAPPVIKFGNIGDFSFTPNSVIDASNDPNAKIEALTIDTTAVENYPALYGLQKSQLLNLVNSPDTSLSSDVGNPSFSKTDAGVKSQQATISVDDNAIRKRFETWFQNWSEGAINLYFAERTGTEKLQLDKETAQRLRELDDFDQTLLNKNNEILIDYDTDTPILNFKVDPNTTSVADKAAQVQDATNLIDLVMKYPMLNANFGGPIDVDVLARRLVVNSGIDDPEQVAPEPTAAQKEAKEQSKNQTSQFSPMYDKPSITINYGDVEDPQSRAKLLELAGAPPAGQLSPMSPKLAENAANRLGEVLPQEQSPQVDPNAPPPPPPVDPNKTLITPDHVLKADAQAHQQSMDHANLALDVHKTLNPPQPAGAQPTNSAKKPVAQSKPKHNPLDAELASRLKQLGLSDSAIAQSLALLDNGASEQQVLKHLGITNG